MGIVIKVAKAFLIINLNKFLLMKNDNIFAIC